MHLEVVNSFHSRQQSCSTAEPEPVDSSDVVVEESSSDASSRSGGGGIRTHGTVAGTAVFKTAPIDHSGTPPGFSATGFVDDLFRNEDRDVSADGDGNRVARSAVDVDQLSLITDPKLSIVSMIAEIINVNVL